jgi:hypothetical protein
MSNLENKITAAVLKRLSTQCAKHISEQSSRQLDEHIADAKLYKILRKELKARENAYILMTQRAEYTNQISYEISRLKRQAENEKDPRRRLLDCNDEVRRLWTKHNMLNASRADIGFYHMNAHGDATRHELDCELSRDMFSSCSFDINRLRAKMIRTGNPYYKHKHA